MKNARKIDKAIVLCGNRSSTLLPMTRFRSRSMLPVLNKPIIYWQLVQLAHAGIKEVMLCVDQGSGDILEYVNQLCFPGLRILWHVDEKPQGTAGCIRDCRQFLGQGDVVVINNTLFLDGLGDMMQSHLKNQYDITLGVSSERRSTGMYGTVVTVPDESLSIQRFEAPGDIPKPQRNKRFLMRGVYIMSPMALGLLDSEKGYFDLKEQFLPFVKKQGGEVVPFELLGFCRNVHRPHDYSKFNQELLRKQPEWMKLPADMREVADGIFSALDVDIDPSANLIKPVYVGSGAQIGKNAQVVGPVVLGQNCKVEEGSLVLDSILWEKAVVSQQAAVRQTIVCSESRVPKQEELEGAIVISDKLPAGELALVRPHARVCFSKESGVSLSMYREARVYQWFKRAMDVFIAVVLLFVLWPVMLVIACAIKLESKGPVFFRQNRIGRFGKEFKLFKFRSMVTNAEALYHTKEYQQNNEVDGPVFKIENDPRITRVGRLLRSLSLDELPQLFNVIMGEMSLVGPRPLARNELRFCTSWCDSRLAVRPGVTGPWQVWGRNSSSFHNWIEYDLMYLRRQSISYDLYILCQTFWAVAHRTGT